ncbi:RNB domain-containing ribonuclease [Rhodothermus profundi]|uniref:Exoribonuclease-2 n=1 Tax=Rhodothermus profundi TaxID=633813 RepID=A0A1M6UP96_9BACT|nr:RNB domain-containing ribonuclease [Rhodothermus profundi]SHK71022.1 exoribonuclease-2 [Rhodothermus profundi]
MKPGTLVEYLEGDRPQFALVLESRDGAVQALTPTGRRIRLPARRIAICHERTTTAETLAEIARTLETRIETLQAEIDLALLWETAREEGDAFDLKALAHLYFGESGPLEQAALLRALLADTLYFGRRGLTFTPRTPEQVEALQTAERRRREREAERQALQTQLEQLLDAEADELSEVPTSLLDALEAYLRQKQRSDATQVLAEVARSRGMTTREAALNILLRTGRLDASVDTFALLAGIEPTFPPEVQAAAEALVPFASDSDRTDFTHLPAFHIDDATTREIDDAFTVESLPDGGWRIGIHLADVPHFVAPDDALDQEARRRGLTRYLPTGAIPMFPERLSHELASLCPDTVRPTLSVVVTTDATGQIQEVQLTQGQIRVGCSFTYEEADAVIAGRRSHELAEALQVLARLGQKLTETRLARGALLIRRPELKVQVEGSTITLKVIDPDTPARRMVSEWMILANAEAARWAAEHELPMIYRVQDPPDDPTLQGQKLDYDPVRLATQLRSLRRTRLSTHPQPHAGLGLEAYVQITSPIRRYADLALQRQIVAALAHRPLPYDTTRLFEVLATAEAAEREARALERQATRYWALVWLSQQAAQSFEAIVIARRPAGYLVELQPYGLRGLLATADALVPGEQVTVRPEAIDPRRGRLRLQRA